MVFIKLTSRDQYLSFEEGVITNHVSFIGVYILRVSRTGKHSFRREREISAVEDQYFQHKLFRIVENQSPQYTPLYNQHDFLIKKKNINHFYFLSKKITVNDLYFFYQKI